MENLNQMDPESLRLFFSLSLDMFCISGSDGYFKHVNDSWTRVLGYSSDELTSKAFLEFVHPEDIEKTLACLNSAGLGEDVTSFENRYRCQDGSYRCLRWMSRKHPQKDLIFAVARDVSDQKAHEQKLTEKKAEAEAQIDYLYSLLSQVPALAAVLKGPELIFDFANPQYCALVGNRNVVGLPLRKALPDLDESIYGILNQVFTTGEKYIAQELPILADWRADGKKEVRHFTFVYSPLKNQTGEVHAIWCLALEVSALKKMEGRLQISERMASLGTMAAGVAHEVNNPLAYLMLSLELISARLESSVEVKSSDKHDLLEKIKSCETALERIRKIVQSLKSFSRNEEEKKVPISIHEVLESTLPFVAHEIKHRAALRVEAEEVPMVLGNSGQLSQVFINLLVNAAHAIPMGKVDKNLITVSIKNADSELIEISIADTGCGIPPEYRQKIFEPFFTSKSLGEGTGLGLTLCHGIITSMGGTISVDSEVGHGSIFRIRMPAIQNQTLHLAKQATVPKLSHSAHILIVDDEVEFALDLGSHLRERHHVCVVKSIADAICTLQSDSYDLVFTDIIMPEGTGLDLFHYLKENHPKLADSLVFMTGGVTDKSLQNQLNALPHIVLEKPFRFADIEQVIQDHMKSLKESA